MLNVSYFTGVRAYRAGISFASIFGNEKAKKWIAGRENWKEKLTAFRAANKEKPLMWFHASSLGEFEQVKPLIEKVKEAEEFADHLIFITFFSPSGYEYSLEYKEADLIFYLPLDTESNAKYFVSTLAPDLAVFVKYDFWFNYLNALQSSQIPIIYFSCNFRPTQVYFKSYARWQLSILEDIDRVYTLNKESKTLLDKYNFKHSQVCGDTRYDKVIHNAERKVPIPILEKFSNNQPVMILGSSWQPEENLIGQYLTQNKNTLKVMIAPHDISEKHLQEIEKTITVPMLRFSELSEENVSSVAVVLIDNIGILSNSYQYADFAFIGGGFTNSLHNILEAAAFANVVFYGAKFSKYPEGKGLLDFGGSVSVANYSEFETQLNTLLAKPNLKKEIQKKAKAFVYQHKGATDIVFKAVKELL